MNTSVPSPKNWPEGPQRRKKTKLRVISQGTTYDSIGQLRRIVRCLEKESQGELRGFVASFIIGRGESISYRHANYGLCAATERREAARSLSRWLEEETK